MLVLRRSLMPAALVLAVAIALLGFFALTANAQTGATETPRTDTLQVTNGEVFDSVVLDNRIIVVGTFTEVRNAGGPTINQPYIAAYNADTGLFDESFRPDVDAFVNAVDTDGTNIFIVGQFSNVDGEPHRRIAKINPDGSVNSQFTASFGSTPNTLAVAHNKVYVGGPFTLVNNQQRTSLAAVDANTGALDTETDFDFSFSNQAGGGVAVLWLEISNDESFMFVSHGARFIDDEIRSGIARFDISPNSTTLNNWQTLLYDNELDRLGGIVRARRVAIAPDDSYVVMVTSGGDRPPAGDTAVRFPTSGGADVQADWVSRHFDTVLGVAINDNAVFIGGHFQFQEAPGSDDPFPGDPFTNFGFGQNQGPLALGDQVVQREQLGALNPNTGKSLAWNPGSDSFIGVQSLTWDDRYGLLVGHDGNRLGGINNIGRHAIFPRGNTPQPPPPPPPPPEDFSCVSTFNNGSATITFEGDLGSSVQAIRNGAWAATVTGTSVTINANEGDLIEARLRGPNYANPFEDIACTTDGGGDPTPNDGFNCTAVFNNNGTANITFEGDLGSSLQARRNDAWAATVTGTSVTINANQGDLIEARLRGPNYANPFEDIECSTGNATPGGGVTQIETIIDTPGVGAVVNAGTVTISGQSEAPGGIRNVRLSLVRRATGEYLNADGTYTAEWAPLDINLNTNNEMSDWSIDVDLEFVGDYDLLARTFDNNGIRDTPVPRSFIVAGTGSEIPELIVNTPTVQGDQVTLSGTATDDIGVSSVSFLIQDRDTLEYFREDGSLGEAQRLTTTLSNPGGTETTWTRTLTGLPVGEYQITADAFDESGQRDRNRTIFTQAGETEPPEITLTSGADQKQPSGTFSFAGTATASAGIENVQVLLRNVVDLSGVGSNGQLTRQGTAFILSGTNGGTTRNWTYTSPTLPAGTYDVQFRVLDEIGQLERVTTQVVVGPNGDDLPTTVFGGTNRFAQGVDSLTIDLSGTAADDNGVAQVTIGVFDLQESRWLQPDGTYETYPTPFLADLSAPGSASTDWALQFSAPTAGEYQFFVRAVDSAGQADSIRHFGSLRAYPGDAQPEVEVTQPADGITITGNRITVTGSATDDNSVDEVEVRIRNQETLEYLRSDGSFGNSEWLNATLANPDGTSTNWDYLSPSLPDGDWLVQVRSRDNNNQDSTPIISRVVTLN